MPASLAVETLGASCIVVWAVVCGQIPAWVREMGLRVGSVLMGHLCRAAMAAAAVLSGLNAPPAVGQALGPLDTAGALPTGSSRGCWELKPKTTDVRPSRGVQRPGVSRTADQQGRNGSQCPSLSQHFGRDRLPVPRRSCGGAPWRLPPLRKQGPRQGRQAPRLSGASGQGPAWPPRDSTACRDRWEGGPARPQA